MQMLTLCCVIEFESRLCNGTIRAELKEQIAATHNRSWRLRAAEAADRRRRGAVALVGRQSIISAKYVTFYIECIDKMGDDISV